MELLKERILKDGTVRPGQILKVDSFLNHQMDIDLINEIGKEFYRRFEGQKVTKIMTIEASGIGIACITAQYFHVPVVFLAACYVTLDNGHTTIDILSSHFPRAVQKVCNTIGYILGVVMCSFVAVMGIGRMNQAIANHTKSSTTGAGFPIWPFILVFVVGFFLLAISFLWSIIRLYCRKEEPVVAKPEEGGDK